ncbi:MAG: DMT family transporter [Spirochaetia bacterium]|nr:DMT family transporter [Spirochaetia bacterium]
MQTTTMLYIFLAALAGAIIPFQSGVNAQLGKSLDSPIYATLMVFVTGTVGIAVYIVAGMQSLPSVSQFSEAPKWTYLGGILGAVYIMLVVVCAPRIGIGSVTIAILLGQVVAALVIDQFGLLGTPVHPISAVRFLGVCLTAAGVILVQMY